ncbi:MAG: FAD-containing oxidoreductase [bacterium]|nr:FAD-containing oxidoreductase [bacterium]
MVAVLVVVAVVAAVRLLPVNAWLLAFVGWMRDAGAAGMAVYVLAYVAACVLFVPGLILTLGGGFAYGVAAGVPLVWVAANLGAAVAFLLGRTLLRERIAARVAGDARFAAIDRAVGREGFKVVLLTRLSPAFPFSLLNYAYGLTTVSFRDYALGSLLGMIPGTAMYVYLGSLLTSVTQIAAGAPAGNAATQALTWLGAAATVAVTVVVTRLARRALDEATAASPGGAAVPIHRTPHDPARPLVLPDDTHNRALVACVHPPGRRNPTPSGRYNLVVVGGGTAGLVAAAGGAGLGAKVALVERALMGGDCLNTGCVPSKALIASARAAAAARRADRLGVRVGAVDVDFPAVMARLRALRARIARNDSVQRFEQLGVEVHLGDARFTGPRTIEVDGRTLAFSCAVVATGARAAVPPIPGLAEADFLTNETLFELTELPRRLVVLGGGPVGCEMAQAFAQLGATVTLVTDAAHILPREDADAAAVVARRMAADGVRLVTGATVTRVLRIDGATRVDWRAGDVADTATGDRLLVAAGRTPNLGGLGLEAAGVAYGPHGVTVDDHLRTTNRRVFAAGDVASRFRFTHTADALARIVLTNALFLGRRKASALTVPWCTYTSPELAHTGLSAAEAQARGIATTTLTLPLHDVDRAIVEDDDEGFLRVVVRKGSDAIVGATLIAANAGDVVSELTLAIVAGVGLGTVANVIHPYPTQAEVVKKAGDAYNRTRLTPTVKSLFAWWLARNR